MNVYSTLSKSISAKIVRAYWKHSLRNKLNLVDYFKDTYPKVGLFVLKSFIYHEKKHLSVLFDPSTDLYRPLHSSIGFLDGELPNNYRVIYSDTNYLMAGDFTILFNPKTKKYHMSHVKNGMYFFNSPFLHHVLLRALMVYSGHKQVKRSLAK